MTMVEPVVVEVERSGFVESVHLVDVAVVDASGALVASAGDPDRLAAFRSSAKPLQARASLEAGWQPSDDAALALTCASHNGEPGHVELALRILAGAGLEERHLRCPPDIPFWVPAALEATQRRTAYHNCSGKHAGMLAACVAAGWELDTYRDATHPLQERVVDLLDGMGIRSAPLIDGCGVPTLVAPLRALAHAFRSIDDGGPETRAMRAHPWMVGGTERLDTDLMSAAPHLVVKAGAEGLACASDGLTGVAIKARDGAARFRGPALLLVLTELGLVEQDALPQHREVAVLGGGAPVGLVRARGRLVRA